MNIVFDFGGVLFRWAPQRFLARVLPHRAGSPEAAQALVTAFFQGYGGDWGEFDRGRIEPGALAERIAARTGLPLHEVKNVIDAVPAELAPIDASVALLLRLHDAGHPLFYLSNMPEVFAEHLERSHAFLRLFRRGVFSSRVGLIKPEPAIFEHAVQAFGIVPGETLFIDDYAHNVAAAQAAGWQALHFHDPAQCEAALREHGLI